MCAELTKTVALTSCTISRALFCPGEKTRPRGRRKDGIGRIPCDHLQHLEFMISGGVTAPAAQPGAGDSPKALQGHVEDPGSFRGHQPGTRTGQRRCQTRPKSECPPRCSRARGEQTLPGVCQSSRDGAEALCKAWTALESVLAQKTIIWGKQVTPTLQSHPGLELTGLQILLGTGSKGPAHGNTYGKTSEELILIHPSRKWDSGTLASHPGGSEGPSPTAQGC